MKKVRLTAVIWKEDVDYVSKCPELGVASAGKTPQEAVKNLEEAVELYLQNAKELGMLKDLSFSLEPKEKYTTTFETVLK